jgi:putative NADH-flavin reductase
MLIVELRESDPELVALVREAEDMPGREDTAIIAGQLADLTRTVEGMATQLQALGDRADGQQQRADTQHERIDLAARELTEVSDRLHAAANALRESI